MSTLTRSRLRIPESVWPILFAVGIVALIGTWALLYSVESLFTESHLVGYYCCVTEQDLPALGTLERTLSDFFRGMHLPSLVFVAVNLCLFVMSVRRARNNYWWLPYLFIICNILYLQASSRLVSILTMSDSLHLGEFSTGLTRYSG